MYRPLSRFALFLLIVTGIVGSARAQEAGLQKTAKGYKHAASGVEFELPEKWEVRAPQKIEQDGTWTLGLDRPPPRITVTLYWAALRGRNFGDYVKLKPGADQSYGIEHATLAQLYGKDKVSPPEALKVGERTVYRIKVSDGPSKDGKSVGVLYVFEAGPNPKERFRIKMRATYAKMDEAEHLKTVEALLANFK